MIGREIWAGRGWEKGLGKRVGTKKKKGSKLIRVLEGSETGAR